MRSGANQPSVNISIQLTLTCRNGYYCYYYCTKKKGKSNYITSVVAGFNFQSAEVCHPRCVFKLYGGVNSVKNITINIRLNDGVY